MKKIYRSEKVIKELKAEAQLKAEVKVNVTCLNKEVLENNNRSLKDVHDKPPSTKISQQRDNVLPDSTVENEHHCSTTVDENISTHLNDSINNNDDDKDKDKQEPTQNNHINSSCNSSRAHHLPANSSSSKSRSFFDSFCPNLFFENIQNLQKTNKIVKREVDKHPYRPSRQQIPTPKDINKHDSPHRNTTNDVGYQRDENIRERIFPQKNISDSNVRSLITSNISFKQKESSANTDSMNSETTNPVSHVIKPFNRSSIDEESNHPRSLKSEHLSTKSHDSKDIQVKQIDKHPDKQIDNGLKIDCEISNSTANNSSSDISLADNLLPLKPVSTTCNKIKANISPKSLKCLKQNSSILKRSFVRRFERNSKQDTSQRILKRKHLLLKIKLPIKSHMSLALGKDETTTHEVGITNSTSAPSASSVKEESKTIFREEDDAKDRNKHRDCDSDDTDICDYDDQLEERHHPKNRRQRVDNPKNECRMGEEEKSDSRSELGSDGSYDTTDEELKTRRLAVLSLLPSKTTHQISSKVSDSSVRNGKDATRNISINSLSLTDSILKLGGKRVNKEALTELQNMKKKQRKIQKIEPTDTANEQSKEKRWLRHRKKHYYESEHKEIKTCKKLSLMEAKSKGFLNSKTCSEDASSNQSRQNNNEVESSDSSKSCHSNNKPETAKNNNDNNNINNSDAVKSKSDKLLKKQSKQKGKKNNVPTNGDLKRIEEPSDGKDSENDKNDWLVVDDVNRDGTGGDDGVKVGEKQIKRLKKQGRLEKSFNGGEQKIEKKEPGKVGRKRKKVNEDGNGNDPPSEKKESLQESFVLSRELGPKFNWLEHKIQQNYKNDSTDGGDIPSKSMQQIDQIATTSPNNSSNIPMMEVEKKSKHKEGKPEKHPKSSSTVENVESIEDAELLTHAKQNSTKNKPSHQRDITGTDHKENSSKKDVADKNHVTTEEPETSISDEVHHTQPPQKSQANSAHKSEPLNLIDLTSDNPSDQMNSNPIYNNKFQPKDNRFHNPNQQSYVGESLFDQADSFSRRMGNSDGQPRFRTMSPSFDFSDPILLQEYRQKFDHYLKVKQIVDAKQREIMKLDLEKEKLKRDMIILLNMQNKISANQSVYSQPRQIGKVPIPVPSPPSIHATKLLSKQGLTSPSFLSGMNNFHGDESKMDSSSSIVQKLSSRRYFPHEVTYERHPRDGRIDYLPSQSNRHDEVNNTIGDADHPPKKSISVQSTNDINNEFPFTHIDQFYNDSQSNGFKIPPTRHPESTYGLRDVPPAKPFTSQTLNMCYNVHKEFLEQAKKLTPNFKSPQILFQTLPASDRRHLGGKLSPSSSPANGIQYISTPAASSPDVIITNASIRTLQGEKFVDTSRELNFERARQDYILYKRCQNETLRNSPPLKIPKPSAAESKASPIKQIDDKIDDQENNLGFIDEKLALDLSMKPPQEQSKDEVMAESEVVEDDKICIETQVLDLSIPINLKVSNKDELGVPAHIVQHTSENSNQHESQLNPLSDKIRAIDKSNASKSPPVSHQDESSHLPASMVPYTTHNFPEWMDNKKESGKIANSTEFNLDRSSINKDEKEFVESDKKSDGSCGRETPLTIVDNIDAFVKQAKTVDDKTSVIHSDEEYNVFSSSDNYQPINNNNNNNNNNITTTNNNNDNIINNNVFNESKFKVSNNRPNSCGDFLHVKAQKCVSPTLQSRSRSANIPLVACNMTYVKSSLSDAKETTFYYNEESPIKKDFETKAFKEEISPTIDHHHHHHHKLEIESKVKAHESYKDEDETLLNLSLKPKLMETPLPPSSTSSSRPSPLEDQKPDVLSDKAKAIEKLPSRHSAQNDDEITSKNSMMMMMMMMMGQSTSSIDRKPEMLSLDSVKFNAHLDETIKKELQTGEKDHIPDSIDLSSSLKSSDGRTAKSISQDKSSNESERNVEDPGYRFPTHVIKPHSSPSPLVISHEENPPHNLRHSINPQKEHSTKAETSYYRQPLPQQTSCGPPFIPPIIQQPSNQHPIAQHHQQSYQGKQQHKIMQQQHHQMLQNQLQLEQLQRSRKSSPVSRTRHPSSPVTTKHSKSYFRSDVDHLSHSDIKNGNSVVSKLEKFTMADQTSRKQPSDVLPKRHYPETDAAQKPYYTSPQHVHLQHYQQLQQAYGAQSSLRSYSPPIRTSQRAHDIHQLQLEHQRRFQQKGIKYPIPLLAQSSQLVHQLNNPDSRDPQTYSKPISSSRYKPQTNNFTHEVRGYPGIGPSKESLSPTGFSVLPKSLKHPDSLDPSLYTKLPVLPKHFIETTKPQAHDPILKSYPNAVDTYITRYHHKQPRKIEPHVEAVDLYDSVLMRGTRHPGYPKTLNDAPRVYDHGYRSTLGSEIDRRGIPLRGTTSSSPHLPMVPPSATREILTHNNKLPEDPYCFNCFKPAHFICSTCKKVSYCCKNCQAESWEKGHKDECR